MALKRLFQGLNVEHFQDDKGECKQQAQRMESVAGVKQHKKSN